ncbi:hypothetical protein H4R19_003904 [Coemansia spiralis]|nr:hypothetical protein H4R19_003904 [Coemansia spiralis]
MAFYVADGGGKRGAKRPEVTVTLHDEPVVVWASSGGAMVSGTVEIVSQSAMPACTIRVMLVGTQATRSAKCMGRSTWQHNEFLREEQDVQCNKAAFLTSDHACAAGKYVVPFAFALGAAIVPTLSVPHFRAEYTVAAILYCQPSLLCTSSLQIAGAQRRVAVASYALSGAPTSIAACPQPVSRWGVLGAEAPGCGMFPFCISMDRSAVRAGDTVRLRLDIYPPAEGAVAPEVTAYNVSTRLVQRTCRVARKLPTQAGTLRTVWTQHSIDPPAAATGTVDLTRVTPRRRLRAEWPLHVPSGIQSSVQAAGIIVCYEVCVGLAPRAFAGGLVRRTAKRMESWSGAAAPVSSKLLLVVVPGWPPAQGEAPPPSYMDRGE